MIVPVVNISVGKEKNFSNTLLSSVSETCETNNWQFHGRNSSLCMHTGVSQKRSENSKSMFRLRTI